MHQTIRLLLLSFAFALTATSQETKRQDYAGEDRREIKSLSAEEIEQLLQGHGMGLAKAAELNHYPGPRHVLELAAQLQLTPEQRARTQETFARMRGKAMPLGRQIVEREKELDALFAKGDVNSEKLQATTSEIARLQGLLRLAHLTAHLEMRRLLSPAQIRKYDVLRGYSADKKKTAGHEHSHGKH